MILHVATVHFFAEEYSIVYINHILLIHSKAEYHLSYLQCLTIVNEVAMNICMEVFLKAHIFISLA